MPVIGRMSPRTVMVLALIYLILIFFAGIYIYPLIWAILNSLKGSAGEIFSNPWAPPKQPTFKNYIEAWQIAHFDRLYLNSMFVTSATIFLITLITSLAGYSFSRFKFSAKDILFLIVVSGYMIPPASLIIPLYHMMRSFGLLDNLVGLILAYVGVHLPLTLFIIRAYYESLPKEVEEAAIVDGASLFTIFWDIVFPLMRPGIAAVAIWTALNTWNEFLYALTFLSSPEVYTVPVGLLSFYGSYFNAWGLILAGFVIVVAPLEIFYILFQKQIIAGLTRGALKA